ncbi:FtsK/SpoIIIE family DNA translocase [Phycisphaera mikurensis]|uniref:Putative DNA translocase FtsK n=1 Tax=Phycisphaera mikurensis (strain NBRC 102666 / KCTC 22515 / FYK2301M01) TaxID=1142394 RepID=I0IH37_PHYMF|nr:DNA translocase FtsK [Phycisphaera mikurensis]MBB6440829.1 S-DNA-T family DNA segregation ATPase FtsK/SpoIIIE [Phycisphaera mikurensis]BAM04575.1 putative DNA translocase FtsK [Phycisphaera mikurensis NBRC 102666]
MAETSVSIRRSAPRKTTATRRKPATRSRAKAPPKLTAAQKRHRAAAFLAVCWSVAALAWVLAGLALGSHDPADAPAHALGVTNVQPNNWVGAAGAAFSHRAVLVLGPGVWVAYAAAGLWLAATAAGRRPDQSILRLAGVGLMTAAGAGLASVGHASFSATGPVTPEGPGGLLGLFLQDELVPRFAGLGAMLILGVVFWVGAVLAADRWVLLIPRLAGAALLKALNASRVTLPPVATAAGNAAQTAVGAAQGLRFPRIGVDAGDPAPPARANDVDDDFRPSPAGGDDGEDPEEDHEEDEPAAPRRSLARYLPKRKPAEPEPEDSDEEDVGAPAAYVASKKAAVPGAPAEGEPPPLDAAALKAKMAKLPVNFAPKIDAASAAAPEPGDGAGLDAGENEPVDLSGYRFPGVDLLVEPEGSFREHLESYIRRQGEALQNALNEFGIQAEVVNVDSGPVITLFEIRLAPGTKVSRISAIDSDVARALKAPNIRVVANMAGKDTVGIEVPNEEKERVRLRELLTANPGALEKMKLPMFLGKDASGNPLIQDLNAMPHMLIAGTTGSGKSVCMNSIIMSFLLTKKPDELKLVLVDPKMVEMSQFKSIPHLMCPVVTEMSKAAAILEWAVTKMDERYELLAEAGVRDIASYNELGIEELIERMEPASDEEESRIPRKLPYLVFIIDELADLMMTNKEVESHIVRIAQKARAVGMHLILATQRPSANVVTGLIKSNMPCRVCMKVNSGMDSRIILDAKGGELLLGHGDMLFVSPRSSELVRAQGTLVDDHEIRKCTRFLKEISSQSFEQSLVQLKKVDEEEGEEQAFADRDPLFDKAVEVVLETQRGSVSLLQRKLTIGYARSSRIIEQMERYGIIGGHKTAQARKVLVTPEEWEAMIELARKEAAGGESADGVGSDDAEQEVPEVATAAGSSDSDGWEEADEADEEDGGWSDAEASIDTR